MKEYMWMVQCHLYNLKNGTIGLYFIMETYAEVQTNYA